jgi:hypothetical protein
MDMIEEVIEVIWPYLIPIGIPLLIVVVGVYVYYYDEIWEWVVKREMEKDREEKDDDL